MILNFFFNKYLIIYKLIFSYISFQSYSFYFFNSILFIFIFILFFNIIFI